MNKMNRINLCISIASFWQLNHVQFSDQRLIDAFRWISSPSRTILCCCWSLLRYCSLADSLELELTLTLTEKSFLECKRDENRLISEISTCTKFIKRENKLNVEKLDQMSMFDIIQQNSKLCLVITFWWLSMEKESTDHFSLEHFSWLRETKTQVKIETLHFE